MKITDPIMARKMEKTLRLGGNLYTLGDIEDNLRSGQMQGHAEGNSWVITQVHTLPRRKSVELLFVVGEIVDFHPLLGKVESWARNQGATLLTGTGREGWWSYIAPDWNKVGIAYSKDITHG